MTEDELVAAARDVWEMDDQPSVNIGFWRRTLRVCAKRPDLFMNSTERKRVAALQHRVTVYRGAGLTEPVPKGLAWSLSLRKARFFATSYKRGGRSGDGHVFEAAIDRPCIAAFVAERHEEEILIFPEKIGRWHKIEQAAVETALRANPVSEIEALLIAKAAIPVRDAEFKSCKPPSPTPHGVDQRDLIECLWFRATAPRVKLMGYVAVNKVYGTAQLYIVDRSALGKAARG